MSSPADNFNIGDTIAFKRRYVPRQPSRVVATPGAARAIVEPEVAEQILKQAGTGAICALHVSPRKVKSITRGGRIKTTVVHTAKVDAGPGLGYISVVLDDAVIIGKQNSLFDMAATDTQAFNQYGTDGRIS